MLGYEEYTRGLDPSSGQVAPDLNEGETEPGAV